jgi:hypothetical protein
MNINTFKGNRLQKIFSPPSFLLSHTSWYPCPSLFSRINKVLRDQQAVSNNCLHIHQQNIGFCHSSIQVLDLPMGGENARPNMFEGTTKHYIHQRLFILLHKAQNLTWSIMMFVCNVRWISMVHFVVVRVFHV